MRSLGDKNVSRPVVAAGSTARETGIPAGGTVAEMDGGYRRNPLRVHEDRKHRLNFPRALHGRLPGYAPTPLLDLADLAEELGVAKLWVKDESSRLGLHSFEVLGTSWALYREVLGRLGRRPARWSTVDELRERIADVGDLHVVAVSDDGFGPAAARAAALFGFRCTVYLPATASEARIAAVQAEGATAVATGLSWDDAMAAAAGETGADTVVLSDSSWPGFVDIPMWVTEGYGTVFEEVDDELDARGGTPPTVVVVPLGTGALAAAAGAYYRVEPGVTATGAVRRFDADLVLLGAEPSDAACFGASAAAGARRSLPASAPSVLGGLARGLPSPLAWDVVAPTFDGFVGVGDDEAMAAVARLRGHGVQASPAGAAAFAGLDAVLAGAEGSNLVRPEARVLVVCTEGPIP
ncbi:MAG: pyridoxal-phosphate dependent enzyme [Acidimicrobiales bacterium]